MADPTPPMRRPDIAVVGQGLTVIEPDDEGGYLIMYPDGTIGHAVTRRAAERKVKHWYKCNLGPSGMKMGIGRIEWRTPGKPGHA